MSNFKQTFTIVSSSYDANSDDLSVRAFVSNENGENQTYEDGRTIVEISFNAADMSIHFDCEVFESPNTYLPTVLLAFSKAFDEAYASLDHTASPIDAFENLKTFDLEM